jgi:hypothetical protein
MADLERELRELRIEWPPTPDLAAAVRPHLAPRPRRRPRAARLALAAVLLLGGAMAVEPARSAILEVLGLKGARIERREPAATAAPRAPGARLGEGLGLGRPVTLERARRDAGFELVTPGAGLGAPDAVFLDAGRVSLVYRAGPGLPRSAETGAGLLVSQSLASVAPFIAKAAGAGTRVERLRIGPDLAFRLSGRPHGFAYASPSGRVTFEDQRLAGATLLVEHGDVLIRIEGRVPRDRAIAIARSITASPGSSGG